METVDRLLAPPEMTRALRCESRTGELRLRLDRLEPNPDAVRAQRERLRALSARLSPMLGGSVRGFSNHWRLGLAATLWPERMAELVLWIETGALSMVEPVGGQAQTHTSSGTARSVPSDNLDALVARDLIREVAGLGPTNLVVVSPGGEEVVVGPDSSRATSPGATHGWGTSLVTGLPVVVVADGRDRSWVRGALVLATPTLSAFHRLDALSTMLSDTSDVSVVRRLRLDHAIAYDIVASIDTMPGHSVVTCTVSVPTAHRAVVESTVRTSLDSLLAAHDDLGPGAGAPARYHKLRSIRSIVPSEAATNHIKSMALRCGR